VFTHGSTTGRLRPVAWCIGRPTRSSRCLTPRPYGDCPSAVCA
jgi:hypothetical protein